MKTIREIVGQSVGGPFPPFLIAALEAREKERDEAEYKRIGSIIHKELHSESERKRSMDAIYPPPPESEKLPAGYWWLRLKGGNWVCSFHDGIITHPDWEYRSWDDPPPEVTDTKQQ